MNRLSTAARVWLSAPVLLLFTMFLFGPLLILLRYSLASSEDLRISLVWTLSSYELFFAQSIYPSLLLKSLVVAGLTSVLAILIGFPMAWCIARAPRRRHNLLLVLLVIPWWASYVVRVFAWFTLFGHSGAINRVLGLLGLIDEPLDVFTFGLPAVIITELNLFLPLMVIPIYMSLERLDWSMVEAARSLGASRLYAFRKIVLPFSIPGVIAGTIFVFMPIAGTFVVPELIGGTDGLMIGKVIASQFGSSSNWALGAALSMILLVTLLACLYALITLRQRLAGDYY